jgi:D-alanyl-D-alanine carboxypeptidase
MVSKLTMRTKIFQFFIFTFICSGGFGQQPEPLKQIMTDHLKSIGKSPVHSIQIYISKGDSVFHDAVGYSDGQSEKADKNNPFKIASITKTMTAIVILQMQEEGKLNVDEPIFKHLVDVKYSRINDLHYFNGKSYGNSITIKQLMQHRSGIADIFTDAALKFYLNEFLHKKQEWNPEKLMSRYYKYGLNKKAHFSPDSGYFYSDVNYFLLGMIIEKLSGQTLAQQFRARIFQPLNMKDSYFEYYEKKQGENSLAHSFLGRRDVTKTLNTSYDWAGGGVVSTTADLAIFLRSLFEGNLFNNPSSLKSMTTMIPHSLKSGKISYYGL